MDQKLPFLKSWRQFFNKLSANSRRVLYFSVSALDVLLIILVVINGLQPAKRLVSPLVSSIRSIYSAGQISIAKESFSFVPGWATNKFSSIHFHNLTYLCFFDVPLNPDGNLNRDSRGYNNFKSEVAVSLFDRAKSYQTKVLLTVSQMNDNKIRQFLDDQQSQLVAITGIINQVSDADINGVMVDFEYSGPTAYSYQLKFTNFITNLTNQMHSTLPGSIVSVAVPDKTASNLYDLVALSLNSDRVFAIAYDFASPETTNQGWSVPLYGYNNNDYWADVSNSLSVFNTKVADNKLVVERAWYGEGQNYPLYTPNLNQLQPQNSKPVEVNLDNQTIDRLVKGVPDQAKDAARKNIPIIATALQQEGILDSNVLAYALATVEHETDGNFEPIEEIQGRLSARRLGYEGGTNYFGRGFIQLTHLRNYKAMGERIGMGDDLVRHPELASSPTVAARILAAFFKDNNVANLASSGNFVAARVPINPDLNGVKVARLAYKYEVD